MEVTLTADDGEQGNGDPRPQWGQRRETIHGVEKRQAQRAAGSKQGERQWQGRHFAALQGGRWLKGASSRQPVVAEPHEKAELVGVEERPPVIVVGDDLGDPRVPEGRPRRTAEIVVRCKRFAL